MCGEGRRYMGNLHTSPSLLWTLSFSLKKKKKKILKEFFKLCFYFFHFAYLFSLLSVHLVLISYIRLAIIRWPPCADGPRYGAQKAPEERKMKHRGTSRTRGKRGPAGIGSSETHAGRLVVKGRIIKRPEEIFSGVGTFIILMMVMVLWVYSYVDINQILQF